MPTYGYRCNSCSHEFEELQSFSDPLLTSCPVCHKDTLVRMIGGGAGLVFKGSGFYLTDYKKSSTSPSTDKKSTSKEHSKEQKQDKQQDHNQGHPQDHKHDHKQDQKADKKQDSSSDSTPSQPKEKKPGGDKPSSSTDA